MTSTMFSKKPIDYSKWTFYLIILAIIIRFSLAFIYTVSGDACWHLSAARFISEEGKLPLFDPIGRDEPFWAPPLFHIIAAFFGMLFFLFIPIMMDYSVLGYGEAVLTFFVLLSLYLALGQRFVLSGLT